MRIIFEIIKKWLPLAIATAGLCALVYLTEQQSLRMGANDPQIQMAEDAAAASQRSGNHPAPRAPAGATITSWSTSERPISYRRAG